MTTPGMSALQVGVCPLCDKPTILELSPEQIDPVKAWLAGGPGKPFVQVAFPDFTPAQREALISGAHDECFDAAFAPQDEDQP